jgi:chitodextrinase
VAGYYIYRNGTQVGTSSSASYTDTSLSPNTTYSYSVAAYDAAGNVSAQSSVYNVTTPYNGDDFASFNMAGAAGTINTQNGTVNITVPAGTNITGIAPTFTLSTGATATINTTTQVSGTTANNYTSPVSYSITAQDGSVKTYTVTVTAAPDTQAPSVPAGLGHGTLTGTTVPLTWTASTDNVGVTGYNIYSSGTKIASSTTPNYTPIRHIPSQWLHMMLLAMCLYQAQL